MRSHIGRVDGDYAMAVMDVAMASKMVMIVFFISCYDVILSLKKLRMFVC